MQQAMVHLGTTIPTVETGNWHAVSAHLFGPAPNQKDSSFFSHACTSPFDGQAQQFVTRAGPGASLEVPVSPQQLCAGLRLAKLARQPDNFTIPTLWLYCLVDFKVDYLVPLGGCFTIHLFRSRQIS